MAPPDRRGCLGHRLGCVGVIPNSALSGGFGVVLTGPWTWIKKRKKEPKPIVGRRACHLGNAWC